MILPLRLSAGALILGLALGSVQARSPAGRKTFLVVTFDVEDYITPESERIDDIPKWLAEIMSEEGVTGTFFVIGEKARSLEKRGRRDVIAAMARHDVESHTNFGSIHPTVAEELERADWEGGLRRMFDQESAGFADLERIFGKPVRILGRHGGCYGPQLVGALGRLRVGYQGSPVSLPGRDVVWFCNALNFSAQYAGGFDDTYYRDDLFEPAFEKLKAEWPELVKTAGVLALFGGHPCKIRTEQFWDFNFYDGRNPGRGEWKTPDLRPAETMATAQKNVRRLMRYLRGRDDVEITTYRSLMDIYARQKETQTRGELQEVARDTLARGTLAATESFSPAEAFAGIAASIVGYERTGSMPESLPTRHPFGPAERPIERPETARLALRDVYGLARDADEFILRRGALPAGLTVGNARVGTGALFALFCAAYLDMSAGKPKPDYEVSSFDPYPRTNEAEIIGRVEGYKSWPVHRRDLDLSRIVELTRLQLWTLKPAFPEDSGL
jgi:hypothetical protein